ncbi:MAG: glycosyltransferase [Ilumatobacter sp.]|nr:glycosyltransferase [Ilumatobacter sp.]
MGALRRLGRLGLCAARLGAAGVAVGRLARAAHTAAPVRPTVTPPHPISVVIPARDEADRMGPLLAAIVDAPGVAEVIVVDDRSSDGTAELAQTAGARVISGAELPDGWAGKAWALHQGIAAATSEWVVTLDADTRPDLRLPSALVARAIGERLDLLTVGGRFDCPTPPARWLHAAMLTTLVYRFGPPGIATRPDRMMANGQCMTLHRGRFLDAGGMELVRDEVVEDIALARRIAAEGGAVGFLDASELLTVRMFETVEDTWRGWGRSLALPGVELRRRQLRDLVVVVLAQALPLPRLLLRRGDVLDVVLLAARLGTLAGTRSAYTRHDTAYWASPLADVPAAVAIALGIRRGSAQVWRGRTYR